MQNRLVLTEIPSSVPSLPGSADALRDLVEAHGCWVDRFAFLGEDDETGAADGGGGKAGAGADNSCSRAGRRRRRRTTCRSGRVVAAVELHLENVRDRAVKALDGRTVVIGGDLGNHGSHGDDGDDDHGDADAGGGLRFRIRAAPATKAQSRRLAELCPLEDDPGERVQILPLPPRGELRLTVARSTCGGGTGADPWRGGVLLSTQLCSWLGANDDTTMMMGGGTEYDNNDSHAIPIATALFHGKDLLELGAGSAGLPSMTVAVYSDRTDSPVIPRSIVASDGIDEIVAALRLNVVRNNLGSSVDVQHIDWNWLPANNDERRVSADTILFADCVYTDEGAVALCNAIDTLLCPGGHVIEVLPDFRVGLALLEHLMKQKGFFPIDAPWLEQVGVGDMEPTACCVPDDAGTALFHCAGGSGKKYRTLLWKDRRSELR